jgi:hypothetical protein
MTTEVHFQDKTVRARSIARQYLRHDFARICSVGLGSSMTSLAMHHYDTDYCCMCRTAGIDRSKLVQELIGRVFS